MSLGDVAADWPRPAKMLRAGAHEKNFCFPWSLGGGGSVFAVGVCAREGDIITVGGAVGGAPFEPCTIVGGDVARARRLSHATVAEPCSVHQALSYMYM
jgi:hypothetical protein